MNHPLGDPRPSLFPILTGFALAGAMVLGLGFWVASRPAPDPSPTVTLLTPARDTATEGTLELRFRTSAPLELLPTGWGAGSYHLHALVGATELMPGAADIRPLPGNEYVWALPPLTRSSPVQLVWSRANHSRIAEGASVVRQVKVP